jgi:predicted DNA repair protein MutK
MSGLLALLDDIAALTRIAAAQVDDVATQASTVGAKVAASVIDDTAKAGAKSLGVVIDDAAVTPKYVHNLPAARELPIVWKIARGSAFNKLVLLLPLALLLDSFAPWAMTPLLMLGGLYLCFEGAEKIMHLFQPHHGATDVVPLDAARLEQQRVKGAIKTDFILSAEIMTIALASITADGIVMRGIILALVGLGITLLVYGAVGLLVKIDDAGLVLAQAGRWRVTQAIGRGMVKGMPGLMAAISAIGTAAMLWVGGAIVVHGLESLGLGTPGHLIAQAAGWAAQTLPAASGAMAWTVTAALDGLFGLGAGLALALALNGALLPLFASLRGVR